ncbi:MAG: carboxypeptidase regulatory-like domain-containing protein [Planctomycetes bacterium]|nr:carboxypeptidase regulatory-like domain-containing protein [Planctomycetota bacterium]
MTKNLIILAIVILAIAGALYFSKLSIENSDVITHKTDTSTNDKLPAGTTAKNTQTEDEIRSEHQVSESDKTLNLAKKIKISGKVTDLNNTGIPNSTVLLYVNSPKSTENAKQVISSPIEDSSRQALFCFMNAFNRIPDQEQTKAFQDQLQAGLGYLYYNQITTDNNGVFTAELDYPFSEGEENYTIFFELTDSISLKTLNDPNEFIAILTSQLNTNLEQQRNYCIDKKQFQINRNTDKIEVTLTCKPSARVKLIYSTDDGAAPFVQVYFTVNGISKSASISRSAELPPNESTNYTECSVPAACEIEITCSANGYKYWKTSTKLEPNELKTYTIILQKGNLELSGLITDEIGVPVHQAAISAFQRVAGQLYTSAVTNNEGAFILKGLLDEEVFLTIAHPRYESLTATAKIGEQPKFTLKKQKLAYKICKINARVSKDLAESVMTEVEVEKFVKDPDDEDKFNEDTLPKYMSGFIVVEISSEKSQKSSYIYCINPSETYTFQGQCVLDLGMNTLKFKAYNSATRTYQIVFEETVNVLEDSPEELNITIP